MKTKKELIEFMEKYNENREINFHSENAVFLAENFGTPEELATAQMIYETHEKEGYLNSENATLRTKLFNDIWARINYLFEKVTN